MPTSPEALLRQRSLSAPNGKRAQAQAPSEVDGSGERPQEFVEGSKTLKAWQNAYPEIDKHGQTTPTSFMQEVQIAMKQQAMRAFPTSEVWKDVSWISKVIVA